MHILVHDKAVLLDCKVSPATNSWTIKAAVKRDLQVPQSRADSSYLYYVEEAPLPIALSGYLCLMDFDQKQVSFLG